MANYVAFVSALCVISWFHKIVSKGEINCGDPTYNLDMNIECMSGNQLSVDAPPNNKEGALIVFTCKSLLWRTATNFDYCPVKICKADSNWGTANLFCGSDECIHTTADRYRGRRTCSDTGKVCRRWDSQPLESRPYTDESSFPDETLEDAKNYCRDPNNTRGKPWCYTEPDNAIELCGIPVCTDVSIDQGNCPGNYCGDPTWPISDNVCAAADELPTTRSYVNAVIIHRCRSLLAGFNSINKYCPYSKCKSDFQWTSPSLSCGENECYTASKSKDFTGNRICTKDGWECQRWDSQDTRTHGFWTEEYFPGLQSEVVQNFCRDPGGVVGEPWCFTTNPDVKNQTCDIPLCTDVTIDHGTCDPPETTSAPATPILQGELLTYIRTKDDMRGIAQFGLSDIETPITCAVLCTQLSSCTSFSLDTDSFCTLYEGDLTGNDEPINCRFVSIKCYYKEL